MKKVPVEQAVGMTLCHDMTKMEGNFKGVAFKRGHVIRPEDIDVLLRMGKKNIYVWEENAGEIHEDDAAKRMAAAAAGQGIDIAGPNEGKMTLSAAQKGLFKVNREALDLVNSIEDLTIACRPGNYPVEKGDALAGIRIVPLVTKESKIEQMESICSQQGPIFEVNPYKRLKAGLVITGSEVYHGRIKDRFEPVISDKLKYFGAEFLGRTICDDDVDMISKAANDFIEKGADLVVFTGGMSVDPDDLTPAAIKKTAAEIVTHGVPVQPGNMFMLGYRGDVTLVGLPGVIIHRKNTILDIVFPRIFAGERLTRKELVAAGEGGMCLACPVCHYPVCFFGRAL